MIRDDNIEEGDIVVVLWKDTVDNCRWNDLRRIKETRPPIAKHVGWLLNEDDECIRILPGIVGDALDDEEDLEAGYSIIPKCSVVAIKKIMSDELAILLDADTTEE